MVRCEPSGRDIQPRNDVTSRHILVRWGMMITLTREQEAWIDAHVAAGHFSSFEDAVRQLIDERIVEIDQEGDDLAWAKPLVDDARAAVARGDVITIEEHRARNEMRLAALRG